MAYEDEEKISFGGVRTRWMIPSGVKSLSLTCTIAGDLLSFSVSVAYIAKIKNEDIITDSGHSDRLESQILPSEL